MKTFASLVSLLPALASATPLLPRQITPVFPPNGTVNIRGTPNTSGSGCPQGSVSTIVSEDKSVVTLGFDSFQAVIGPGTSIQDHSKNCQIHLDLTYPGGFQWSIVNVTYHGFAQLDAGVEANFFSTYFFSQSATNTISTKATIAGPTYASGAMYTKSDSADNVSLIWSPCGEEGILNVNNRLGLVSNSSTAVGQVTDDDATVGFRQVFAFQWRQCASNTTTSGPATTTLSNLGTTVTAMV